MVSDAAFLGVDEAALTFLIVEHILRILVHPKLSCLFSFHCSKRTLWLSVQDVLGRLKSLSYFAASQRTQKIRSIGAAA